MNALQAAGLVNRGAPGLVAHRRGRDGHTAPTSFGTVNKLLGNFLSALCSHEVLGLNLMCLLLLILVWGGVGWCFFFYLRDIEARYLRPMYWLYNFLSGGLLLPSKIWFGLMEESVLDHLRQHWAGMRGK